MTSLLQKDNSKKVSSSTLYGLFFAKWRFEQTKALIIAEQETMKFIKEISDETMALHSVNESIDNLSKQLIEDLRRMNMALEQYNKELL